MSVALTAAAYQAAVDEAMEDARADYPDVGDDDLFYALAEAVRWSEEWPDEVVREWCRTQMGFYPHWCPQGVDTEFDDWEEV